MIHKRVNWFVLHSVLGVDGGDKSDEDQQKKSSNNSTEKRMVNTYLYINLDDDYEEDISPLCCIGRFLSDLLASGILAVFAAIIFKTLILSYDTIETKRKCPEYVADCFGENQNITIGPFKCTDGQSAIFPVTSKALWCAGWVYQTKTIGDILETLGICGGLLSIVSTIVPFVYYLSYYKNCFYLSWICYIVFPLIPIGVFMVIVWVIVPKQTSESTSSQPEQIAQLTYITFSIIVAMVYIASCWALYRAKLHVKQPLKSIIKCCSIIFLWKIFNCHYRSFRTKYKFYPWCCFYRHCRCFKGMKKWQDIIEEENQLAELPKFERSCPVTPVSISQPE